MRDQVWFVPLPFVTTVVRGISLEVWVYWTQRLLTGGEPIRDATYLITGATDGIGKATAAQLARLGGSIVVVGRSHAEAEHAVADIRSSGPNSRVDFLVADLSSQDQVRMVAREVKHRFAQLNVLINNAGVITPERELSVDGIEMQFAVNYLAGFLLTNLLLDTLVLNAPARIVNVASMVHLRGRIHFEDLGLERSYSPRKAYAQSKLGNVLFTYALARRLQDKAITVNCVHPGMVNTHLQREYMRGIPLRSVASLFAVSPGKGADTIVYLSSSREVGGVTGQYFVDRRARRSSLLSRDVELQERLWSVSAQMVGNNVSSSQ
jgi:NAD(P)-dependent dehydrogenase (short-subunit alcohol dehydrogenase family)